MAKVEACMLRKSDSFSANLHHLKSALDLSFTILECNFQLPMDLVFIVLVNNLDPIGKKKYYIWTILLSLCTLLLYYCFWQQQHK